MIPPSGSSLRTFFPELAEWTYAPAQLREIDLKGHPEQGDELLAGAHAYIMAFRAGSNLAKRFHPVAVRRKFPRLIGCWFRGFAESSEFVSLGAHDLLFQAQFGVADAREHAPSVPVIDLAAGTTAALNISAALAGAPSRPRYGGVIDVSMERVAQQWGWIGQAARAANFPSYGGFRTKDGVWIALAFEHEDKQWQELCAAIGLHQWAGLLADARLEQTANLRETLRKRIISMSLREIEGALAGTTVAWTQFTPPTARLNAVADVYPRRGGHRVAKHA